MTISATIEYENVGTNVLITKTVREWIAPAEGFESVLRVVSREKRFLTKKESLPITHSHPDLVRPQERKIR